MKASQKRALDHMLAGQKNLLASRTATTEGRLMPLSKLYDEALAYASNLHRTQVRKGSGTP
ncbi:hypothetical protein ABIF65_011458 [Bradyrhizobium japonicum]